jgi:hypothetical protein
MLPNGNFEWPSPQQAGLYQARTNLSRQDFSFAINIPHGGEEGNLSRISESDVKKLFPHSPVFYVKSGSRGLERTLSTLTGRDLTTFCLSAAVILFLIETLLVFLLPKRRGNQL